jgi:hypothetical protein
MENYRDSEIRESYRKASLEDSLMDFINSVDESEAFEGYGARFNAKCVDTIAQALNRHSEALRLHRESLEDAKGALSSIKTYLLVLTLCAATMVVLMFLSRPQEEVRAAAPNEAEVSASSGKQSPPGMDNLSSVPGVDESAESDQNAAMADKKPDEETIHTPANDPLLQPVEVKDRIRDISSRVPSGVSRQSQSPLDDAGSGMNSGINQGSGADPRGQSRTNENTSGRGSAMPGESLFDRWK